MGNIQIIKEFLSYAEAEVRSLGSLYSSAVRIKLILIGIGLMWCLQDGTEALLDISEFRSFQGRNADALALYFGEDPARCPFEQGIFGLNTFCWLYFCSKVQFPAGAQLPRVISKEKKLSKLQ